MSKTMFAKAYIEYNGIRYHAEALNEFGEAGKRGSQAGRNLCAAIAGKIIQRKPPIKKRNKRLTKKLDIYNRIVRGCK